MSQKPIQPNQITLDTDTSLTADSDTQIASQKAVKAYVDANAGGSGDLALGDLTNVTLDDPMPEGLSYLRYTSEGDGYWLNSLFPTLSEQGASYYQNIKHKFDSETDPPTSQGDEEADDNANFSVGSRWLNTLTSQEWVCVYAQVGDPGNYTWVQVTNEAGGGASDWGDLGGTLSDQTDLQAALDDKQDELTGLTATPTELNILDGATLSTTELNYVDGVTSAIQTQFDAKPDMGDIPTALVDLDTTVTGSQLNSLKTKVDGIEDGADVTDGTSVAAAGAVMEADTSTASMSFVIDEDSFSSDSDTKVPTQQSVKAYVDAVGGGGGASDAEDVTYDNSISSLTATDVQAAIDEVAAATGGGGGIPQIILSETFGRGSYNVGGGTLTFNQTSAKQFDYDGVGVASIVSGPAYASVQRRVSNTTGFAAFTGNSTFAFGLRGVAANLGNGAFAHALVGNNAPAQTTTPSYTSTSHYGFKFEKSAGVTTPSYTNANGTSETTGTFTLSSDTATLFAQKNNTTNIKYYDNGTLLGTTTTNLPVTPGATYLWSLFVNNNTGNNLGFGATFVTFTKDAY